MSIFYISLLLFLSELLSYCSITTDCYNYFIVLTKFSFIVSSALFRIENRSQVTLHFAQHIAWSVTYGAHPNSQSYCILTFKNNNILSCITTFLFNLMRCITTKLYLLTSLWPISDLYFPVILLFLFFFSLCWCSWALLQFETVKI